MPRVLVLVTTVLVWCALPAAAQTPPPQPIDVVVTTGQATIQAAPDRAFITVSAETRGSTAREAQRKNTDAMRPVQDALRAAKIPADAIRTLGYDLREEVDFVNSRRVSRGYIARNSIEIRVDDITRVGELLELAVGQGATTVGGLRFDLKDQAKLEREALRQAVADARAKAEAAAAGAGRTLDRVIRVEESGAVQQPPMPMYRAVAMEARSADAAVPVSSGQIEVRATATVTSAVK